MLASFFESIRYVGHMYPLVIMRIYLGYTFCMSFFDKWQTGYISLPTVADEIIQNLAQSDAPLWYQNIVALLVIPHWQIWANVNLLSELLIGLSFIFGFLVRPMALVGAFFLFNFVMIVWRNSCRVQSAFVFTVPHYGLVWWRSMLRYRLPLL